MKTPDLDRAMTAAIQSLPALPVRSVERVRLENRLADAMRNLALMERAFKDAELCLSAAGKARNTAATMFEECVYRRTIVQQELAALDFEETGIIRCKWPNCQNEVKDEGEDCPECRVTSLEAFR